MSSPLSRRAFLATGASAAVLAACRGGKGTASSSSTAGSSSGSRTGSSSGGLVLVTFSDSSALLPNGPQRLAMGLADNDGVVVTTPPAPSIDYDLTLDGQSVAHGTAAAHQQGLPRPYFPLEFTPPKAGVYTVTATVGGQKLETSVQIPNSTSVLGVGQKLPGFDTPTVANPQGVQLLCTRQPACPLHDVTLRDALAGGTPVAFLVATPKYCQTAICGPVLDVLLGQKDQFPQIKMLHAEVYPSDAAAQPGTQQVTPIVSALGLTFEPVLYLARADGTITKRIDTVFDGVELHDALAKLAG